MEKWLVASLIFATVVFGVLGQALVSWAEYRRRVDTMGLIRAELDAGREPPAQLYDQIVNRRDAPGQAPVTEVVLFAALSAGFWTAYLNVEGEGRVAFLSVATAMTVTTLACLGVVLFRLLRRADGGQ